MVMILLYNNRNIVKENITLILEEIESNISCRIPSVLHIIKYIKLKQNV